MENEIYHNERYYPSKKVIPHGEKVINLSLMIDYYCGHDTCPNWSRQTFIVANKDYKGIVIDEQIFHLNRKVEEEGFVYNYAEEKWYCSYCSKFHTESS